MITSTKNGFVINRWAPSLILLSILSCDSFNKEDFIPTEKQVTFNENVFYILPGSSVVIDLNEIVTQSFTNARLSISQDPLRGKISQLDKQLLRYKPAAEFTQGDDEFIISVSNNSTFLKSDTVTIIMVQDEDDLPCTYAIGDKAHVKPGSPISVSFLENDRFCGIGSVQVSIQLDPKFGEATLIGDSVIVYTPGAAFTGRDQLVYKLSASSDEAVSYGTVAFSDSKIQTLKTPYNPSSIFFVDENTGFLGGSGGIYKTTDGGEHWNLLSDPPFDPYDYCNVHDIFFVNANHGFAAYSSCVEGQFKGGLIVTIDGGTSWKKINFDQPIHHVFFTSATTGFIGAGIFTEDERQITKIFKTEDGGSSWRETFTSPDHTDKNYVWSHRFAIQFINSSTGYAVQSEYIPHDGDGFRTDKIFKTTDAGEIWTLSSSNENIYLMALAPENIVTAVFAQFGQNNSIARSQDAATWHKVASYPYSIFLNRFSPSGDLAIAVGMINGPTPFDTLSQVIVINKSTDKGATWVEEELDEPLYGFPWLIAIPSDNVAYIVCGVGVGTKIIKYTR